MTSVENLKVVVDVEFGKMATIAPSGETVIGPEDRTNTSAVPSRLSMLVNVNVELALPPWGIVRKYGLAVIEKSGPIMLTLTWV